ncbi:DivIVA domain-containing protein [Plantactinospora soyae]|uniref:DivIVA domain-containing protein n=1 Tax=Plantactinospora soyae TaxID=1544732 RepID=A0A927QYA8_9ACTN|nr:DivIVA domain-containing protein [Plantactinospora soyae]
MRERRFRPARFGKRGLDPAEVREFLERVAVDLAAVHDALARSQQETARLGETLRRWQSRQAGTGNRWEGR